MARIGWLEDEQAEGELAGLFGEVKKRSFGMVPDIYRTMSLRPDFLAGFMQMGQLNFTDGALTRAQHEMIAAYVSAITRCHY